MQRLQLMLEVEAPGDRLNYSRMKQGSYVPRGVGAFIYVGTEQNVGIEGELDPDALDAIVDAVEAATNNMTHVHFANENERGLDFTFDGWGQRWLSRATRELREGVKRELDRAVDTLSSARNVLRRYE